MPARTSPLFRNILLALAAFAALGASVWGGLWLFEPVPVPPIPPPKPRVSFDPRADIRNNPFWAGLFPVFNEEVEPGSLGRPNPFAPLGVVAASTSGVPSGLGTVREMQLNGARAVALAPVAGNGALVLTVSNPVSGGQTYEIRQYSATDPMSVIATWNVPSSVGPIPAATPVALRQDGNGRTWVLFANGAITPITASGSPDQHAAFALPSANAALAGLFGDIRFDGGGRMWVTDGLSVAEGDGTTFQQVNMPAQLSDVDRRALGLSGSEQADFLNDLFKPWRLQMQTDGRMTVFSSKFSSVFPLDLQARAMVLTASSTESILAVTAQGAVWSMLLDSSSGLRGMARHDDQVTKLFLDPVVLPKQVGRNGFLSDAGKDGLVALDYATNGTTLWHEVNGSWVAQTLAPVGSQPPDTVRRIMVDSVGNIWAILNQKGLLLVAPPRL